MPKPSILFVDDEAHVLNGLRRMLHAKRAEWDMSFAGGGAEALHMADGRNFDVVVSDMRMPGMDGATLLDKIRRRFPRAVRIILSGYSEAEAIYRTIGPAHQYFAKPCDSRLLINVIHRALALRRLIHADPVIRLIGGAVTLPALPKNLIRLVDEMQSPDASAGRVSGIIEEDIALTAQVLKLTNSAYFALTRPATTVQQAVRLLGLDTVRALILMSGVFEAFRNHHVIDIPIIERLEERSLTIGAATQAIAAAENLPQPTCERARCAGMLAHVGSLLLMANWPDKVAEVMSMLDHEGGNVVERERATIGAGHPEVGAYLLGLWGFSDDVVEAVAYHHQPGDCLGGPQTEILAILHVAQHLIKPPTDAMSADDWRGGLDQEFLRRSSHSPKIGGWEAICRRFHDGAPR